MTFGEDYQFTEHLRSHVAQSLPDITIKSLVYPQYETRGDLGECVSRFRNWYVLSTLADQTTANRYRLEEKVIDMEVDAGTPSPTVDPSVRVILVGHSMGGIVAVETVLGIAAEKPIYSEDGVEKSEILELNSLLFPYVQGVLAFDTPYLGIAPGVVAHGAESHYNTAASTISQLSGLGATLWGANAANKTVKAAPAAAPAAWSKWSKVAMVAGAAGAVAAGGAAAWINRDNIAQGWTWASSHLEFVGCLGRAEELKKRVKCMVQVSEELHVGYANLYTRLGKGAESTQATMSKTILGKDRTFCNLPSKMQAGEWRPAVNDKAVDETTAHTSKFGGFVGVTRMC